MNKKPIVLCIMDGWGLTNEDKYSAITKANPKNYNFYLKKYPNSKLNASGEFVGLPFGQMGNSEVGHTNIGAGRIVLQTLPMINKDVENNTLKDRKVIKNFIEKLKNTDKKIHLIGLMSNGGVHSHINHIINIANVFSDNKINVNLHFIADGRDVSQKSALIFVEQLKKEFQNNKYVKISTISGRFYSMDRDKRWDRIEKSYNTIVMGESENNFKTIEDSINYFYSKDITDEFFVPSVIDNYKGINDGDAFLFCNFRADRAREITSALGNKNFDGFNEYSTDEFILFHMSGKKQSRAEFFNDMKNGNLIYYNVKHDSLKVDIKDANHVILYAKSQLDANPYNCGRSIYKLESICDFHFVNNKWMIKDIKTKPY